MAEPHPTIRPQPGILEIALYQGGESRLAGHDRVLKLSSNENPFGPSPKAIAAFNDAAQTLALYPSSDHAALRGAIADVHGLDPARIICGAESDEIIAFLTQAYAGPGLEVIHTEHGFGMYRISAWPPGRCPWKYLKPKEEPTCRPSWRPAPTALRWCLCPNPNNPTGTMIPAAEITRLAAGIPPQALLVLDGAYAEFVNGFNGHADLVDARDNVVMTRTFSKIHGLGGLRVGWGYGPAHLIDVLNRVRGPFNLSTAALAAAEAAVRDTAYAEHCRSENKRNRKALTAALRAHGLACDDPEANFVLARFRDRAEAEACDHALRDRGIIVRKVAGYKLPNCLRITVGDAQACGRVADAIGDFVKVRA